MIDIKLSLSRRIFDQNNKNSDPKITFLYINEWAKKPFHASVPLKVPTCEILDLSWILMVFYMIKLLL
jgi:hypothetical protein